MSQYLQSLPIVYEDARAAYPLVSLYDGSISLEEWMQFARRRCAPASAMAGLMGIRDRRGVIHALFGYRIDIDMRACKKLSLSNLVVAQMPGSNIDDAVVVAVNELAQQHNCRTVTIEQRFSRIASVHGPQPTSNSLLANRIVATGSVRQH